MEDYELSIDELFEKYKTSINGISDKEAIKRSNEYGLNEIVKKNSNSFLKIILNQFKDFLVWLLIISAVISIIIEPDNLVDSMIIFFVVILNAILGIIQEEKASKALNKIKSLRENKALVKRDGLKKEIKALELVPGDLVYLKSGDYIPADIRIIEASKLEVNEANMTGEAVSVIKNSECYMKPKSLGDITNILYSSTYVTKGSCVGIVIKTGNSTEIGKIAKSLDETKNVKTPLQNDINKLSKIVGISVIIIAFIVYLLELIVTKDILSSFKTSVALSVAAIPEGLQAVITMVLAVGVLKISKNKAIIKKLQYVEGLGSISIIATDKTGTVTTGNLKFIKAINSLGQDDLKLIDYAALASDKDNYDSLEKIINTLSNVKRPRLIKRRDFDSTRKMATYTYKDHNEYVSYTKGAFDVVIKRCVNYKNEYINKALVFAKDGYRVLAIARKQTLDVEKADSESNMTFLGLILFEDEIRPEAKASIIDAKKAGIIPVMITGDYIDTAISIAKRVNIFDDDSIAYDKEMLDKVSKDKLKSDLLRIRVFARVNPMDKLNIIKMYQERNEVIAMTGDGVNDAAALKASNIGIAMGNGADIAKDSAGIILTDNSFSTIVKAIEEGRRIFKNIKKSVMYLLSSNIGEVFVILISSIIALKITDFSLPLLPIHLLFVNLVTDSLPAIAIGMDKTDKGLLHEKPRDTKKGFFNRKEYFKILKDGVLMGLLTIIAYLIGRNNNSLDYARTMAFQTLSLSQLFYAYEINLTDIKDLFRNKLLNLSFIIGIIIIFLVSNKFNSSFHLESLKIIDIFIVVSLSSFMLISNILFRRNKKV